MTPRALPTLMSLALWTALQGVAAQAQEAVPAEAPAAPAAADSAPAQAGAPQPVPGETFLIAPAQASPRLNFWSREALAAFPADQRPPVKPWCSGTYFAPPLPRVAGDNLDTQAPVYVSADSMALDDLGESRLQGRIEVRQGQRLVRAQGATITQDQDRVLLEGPVFLQDRAMTLEAGSAEVTLDGLGTRVRDAEYALMPLHVRGRADTIERRGEYQTDIAGAAYTTCEPGHDTWYLHADRIALDQENGWGSATDVSLEVQSVPVFWFPYIRFPIDERRQTGVLYPLLGYSSEDGADIGVPWYWNLDPQYDLLLTPRVIARRGPMLEAEARYLLGDPSFSLGEGSIGAGWIPEDRNFGDEERVLNSFRHLGNPTPQWQLLADATYVSDDYYLSDLGTELSVNRDTHLNRLAQTSYTGEYGFALARVQGFQTIDPTIPQRKYPYRREPQVMAAGARPAGWLPGLEYLGTVEGVAFDRDVDPASLTPAFTNPVGQRTRAEPGLRWTLERSWYLLSPAAKLRYAAWDLERNLPGDTPERAIPTGTLEGRLFFERDLRFRDGDWLQTLEPRAYALKTPYEDQDAIPLFDTSLNTFGYEQLFRDNRYSGGDRIGDAEQLSLALESRLIDPDGREAALFAIGQALYQEDRRVQPQPGMAADTAPRSPLVALAKWRVAEHWQARTEVQWLDNTGEFVSGNAVLNFQDEAWRTLNLGYRYTDPKIDQTDVSGVLPLADRWALVGRWIHDLNRDDSLEVLAGVEYESCCWRTRLVGRRALVERFDGTTNVLDNDDSFLLEIELKGLGSVGEKVSSELADEITGYETRMKALDAPLPY